jgi:hypothetical protein
MLAAETLEETEDDATLSTELAAQMANGFDANGDGSIDEFEGECGLEQIPGFALEAARMQILEGGLNNE